MAEPSHWDDIQKIIEKVSSADIREAFVKTDVYEIRVKKW